MLLKSLEIYFASIAYASEIPKFAHLSVQFRDLWLDALWIPSWLMFVQT